MMDAAGKRRYDRIRRPKKKDIRSVSHVIDTDEENGRKLTLERFLSDVGTHSHSFPVSEKNQEPSRKILNKPVKPNQFQQTTRGIFESALLGRTTLKGHPLSPKDLARYHEDIEALANQESDADFFDDFDVNGNADSDPFDLFSPDNNATAPPLNLVKPAGHVEEGPQEARAVGASLAEEELHEARKFVASITETREPGNESEHFVIEVDPPTSAIVENVPDDREETFRLAKNLLDAIRKTTEEKKRGSHREEFAESPGKINGILSDLLQTPDRHKTDNFFSHNECLWDDGAIPGLQSDRLPFFDSMNSRPDETPSFFEDTFNNATKKRRIKDSEIHHYSANLSPFQKPIQYLRGHKNNGPMSSSAALHSVHPMLTNHSTKQPRRQVDSFYPGVLRLGPSTSFSRPDEPMGPWEGRNHRSIHQNNYYHSTSISRREGQDRTFFPRDQDIRPDSRIVDSSTKHLMTRMKYNQCFEPPLSPRKY